MSLRHSFRGLAILALVGGGGVAPVGESTPSLWIFLADGQAQRASAVDERYTGVVGIYRPGSQAVIVNRTDCEGGWSRCLSAEATRGGAPAERTLRVRFHPELTKENSHSIAVVSGPEKNAMLDQVLSALAVVDRGEIRLVGLRAGVYEVTVKADFRVTTTMRINTEERAAVAHVWPEAAGVSLQVPSKAMATKAEVRVGSRRIETLNLLPRTVGARVRAFPTVWFQPDRTGLLEFHVPGYGRGSISMDSRTGTVRTIELSGSQVFDLRLEAGRRKNGGVSNFTVMVFAEEESRKRGGPVSPPLLPARLESRNGAVVVTDLEAGAYSLWALSKGLPMVRKTVDLAGEKRRVVPVLLDFVEGMPFRIYFSSPPRDEELTVSAVMYGEAGEILYGQPVVCKEPSKCQLILESDVISVGAVAESSSFVSDMPGQTVPVAAGEMTIDLHRKPAVGGRTLLDGRPEPNVEVTAGNRAKASVSTTSDASGHWIASLRPGEWQVAARDSSGRRSPVKVVRVANDQMLDNLDLELEEGLTIKGTTIGAADGKIIPFVEIEAQPLAASPLTPQRAVSDGEGRFRLTGIGEGVLLVARVRGYAAKQESVPPPASESEVREVVVALEAECRLDVTVFDAFGVVKPGTELGLIFESGYEASATTDSQGVAKFESLPAGQMSISEIRRWWTLGASGFASDVRLQTTLAPGEYRQVTIGQPGVDVLLRGTPPRSAAVRLTTAAGDFKVVALDEAGLGSTSLDPAQPISVSCASRGAWLSIGNFQPTVQTHTIDFQLGEECDFATPRTVTDP